MLLLMMRRGGGGGVAGGPMTVSFRAFQEWYLTSRPSIRPREGGEGLGSAVAAVTGGGRPTLPPMVSRERLMTVFSVFKSRRAGGRVAIGKTGFCALLDTLAWDMGVDPTNRIWAALVVQDTRERRAQRDSRRERREKERRKRGERERRVAEALPPPSGDLDTPPPASSSGQDGAASPDHAPVPLPSSSAATASATGAGAGAGGSLGGRTEEKEEDEEEEAEQVDRQWGQRVDEENEEEEEEEQDDGVELVGWGVLLGWWDGGRVELMMGAAVRGAVIKVQAKARQLAAMRAFATEKAALSVQCAVRVVQAKRRLKQVRLQRYTEAARERRRVQRQQQLKQKQQKL